MIIPVQSESPMKKNESRAYYSNVKGQLMSRAFDVGGPTL